MEKSCFFCLITMVLFSVSQLNLAYSAKPSKMAWVRTALLVKIDSSTSDPGLANCPAEVQLVWMNRGWSMHEIKCFPELGSWHTKYFFQKANRTVRKYLIKVSKSTENDSWFCRLTKTYNTCKTCDIPCLPLIHISSVTIQREVLPGKACQLLLVIQVRTKCFMKWITVGAWSLLNVP